MNSLRKRILFPIVYSFLILFLQGEGFGQVVIQRPYKYNVELNSGKTLLGVWMHYDSLHGDNEFTICDTCSPRKMNLISIDVKRILSLSDPIRPPSLYEWKSYKDPPDTLCDTCGKPPDCNCFGHDRTAASNFLDTRLGLNGKGNSSYTFSTASGPQTVTSSVFSPSNIGSTNLTLEGEVAAGWIIGRFDVGLMLAVIPTDGFVYFPFGLHGRYYFVNNYCSYTVFADAGMPIDFATHASLFISPVTSDRQRRFFDIGIGKIWPFTETVRFAIDLGYRYMVIPLAEIQCCPTITGDNRFPARKSNGGFLQAGFSF